MSHGGFIKVMYHYVRLVRLNHQASYFDPATSTGAVDVILYLYVESFSNSWDFGGAAYEPLHH